jgi:SAM-dependent methyltransferase
MDHSSQKTPKERVLTLPVVGYILRWGWNIVRLPKQIDYLHNDIEKLRLQGETDASRLSENIGSANELLVDLNNRQLKFDGQLVEVKRRMDATPATTAKKSGSTAKNNDSELFADDHRFDDFYIKFENKFRGTEEEIKDRQRVYIPRFRKLGVDFDKHPVLDIGCGRGEFLSLLKDEKINAIGLDLNESMVERCNERGFNAKQAEALSYLSKQETGSLGAITGFHIVEHIPFNFLLRLFEECYRVLAPGGVVVFETPNPESLHVGSYGFYYDPSHLHPLVPDVLAFAVENRGFEKAEILRLHPKDPAYADSTTEDPLVAEMLRRFYMEQDYSVIGHKAKTLSTPKTKSK